MTDTISLSEEDRIILLDLTAELRRFNNNSEKEKPDPLLSCAEAADYLKVARQTISAMIRDKRLQKKTRGGRTGLLKSDLDRVKPYNRREA